MFKIVPNLWFDKEAAEAARFYCDAIQGSRINSLVVLRDTPSGDCDLVSFELAGQPFMAISAGPFFKLNPSTSFILSFNPSQGRTQADLEALWNKLLPGGSVLMPLQAYPLAPLYGWIQDRYGLSWQLNLSDPGGEARPFITPALLFVGEVCGKAEEAQDFYVSVFPNARRGATMRYPAGMESEREGTLMYSEFMLAGQGFAAMDSAYPHNFAFNEAISFMIYCDTQAEIDHYWTRLSAVPEVEQCGWLKDRYGLSWQVVPRALEQMLQDPDPERVNRVNQAVLRMKKLDLLELQKAYA
jgi:predicted 3-demethylubiquinone-9 3-methyltransferase (glyoxalase superfamily)